MPAAPGKLRSSEDEELVRFHAQLFKGDREELDRFHPQLGASKVIRSLVRQHLMRMRAKLAEQLHQQKETNVEL